MNFKSLCYDRLKSILGQIAVGETDYQEVASLTEHIGVTTMADFWSSCFKMPKIKQRRLGYLTVLPSSCEQMHSSGF